MTAEKDVRSEVSVAEFEGKSEFHSSSCRDLSKIESVCNGVLGVDCGDNVDGRGKSDSDGDGYVLVGGVDANALGDRELSNGDRETVELSKGDVDIVKVKNDVSSSLDNVVESEKNRHHEETNGGDGEVNGGELDVEENHPVDLDCVEEKIDGIGEIEEELKVEIDGGEVKGDEFESESAEFGGEEVKVDCENGSEATEESQIRVLHADGCETLEQLDHEEVKVEGESESGATGEEGQCQETEITVSLGSHHPEVEGESDFVVSGEEEQCQDEAKVLLGTHQLEVEGGSDLVATGEAEQCQESEAMVLLATHQLEVEGENDLKATAEIEQYQGSQVTDLRDEECKSSHLDCKELKVKGERNVEGTGEAGLCQESEATVFLGTHQLEAEGENEATAEIEQHQESQVTDLCDEECKSSHLDCEEVKVEGESNVEGTDEAGLCQESETTVLSMPQLEVEGENDLEATAEVEQVEESQVTDLHANECKSPYLDNGEVKLEGENDLEITAEAEQCEESEATVLLDEEYNSPELDSMEIKAESKEGITEVDQSEEPQNTVFRATESKSVLLDDGEIEEAGENNLETEAEVEQIEESPSSESAEFELNQLNNGEKEAEYESKSASVVDTNENLEPQVIVTNHGDFDSGPDEEEASSSVDGSPYEDNARDLELNLKRDSSPERNIHSEKELPNGSVPDENGDNLPIVDVGDDVSEDEVVSDNVVQDVEKMHQPNGHMKYSEVVIASSNCEKSETELVNVTLEQEVGNEASLEAERPSDFAADGESKAEDDTELVIKVGNGYVGNGTQLYNSGVIQFGSLDTKVIEGLRLNGGLECTFSLQIPSYGLVNGRSSPSSAGGKSEYDIGNTSTESSREVSIDDGTGSESEVPNGSIDNGGCVVNSAPAIYAANSADNAICQKSEESNVEKTRDDTSTHSVDGSTADSLDENVGAELVKGSYRFLIRQPRYDDENFEKEKQIADQKVVEKTQSRDAVRDLILKQRAVCLEFHKSFEAAMLEERSVRDLYKSKRKELDSQYYFINILKNVETIEELDRRIHNIEHRLRHETRSMKDEKLLLRELAQAKGLREGLRSDMGSQEEIQDVLDRRDQIEEHYELLRNEFGGVREKLSKAEEVTKAFRIKYINETDKLQELQSQFKAADNLRQEAYVHAQNVKKQFYDKNKDHRKYRDDQYTAGELAKKKDKVGLHRLCYSQVETFMEKWNKDDEFRREYIRCNTKSTLRRFSSLDGRSLGPDDDTRVSVDERRGKSQLNTDSTLLISSEEAKRVPPPKTEKQEVKLKGKHMETKSNKTPKPVPLGNGSATVSGRDEKDIKDVVAKEAELKKKKEEEEVARKAEELRKQEAEAKLKEQRRQEEKAKAAEAMERKKRNAEKAQAKAELRAKKEAEQKEKEREKRARKKDKKKTSTSEGVDGRDEEETAPISIIQSEATQEVETKEKSPPVKKRPQRVAKFTKQTKLKTLAPPPPPLRNRGKRRMQPWMWWALAALFIIVVLLLGKTGISVNLGLSRFAF